MMLVAPVGLETPVTLYAIPAWVAPVPAKKPCAFRPQPPEQDKVPPLASIVPVALNVAVPMVPPAGVLVAKVVPPRVADMVRFTVRWPKSPTRVAEFSTPGATAPFARVGLVAPTRSYLKVPLVGMSAAE